MSRLGLVKLLEELVGQGQELEVSDQSHPKVVLT